ncbi:serpin-ZX [Phaseolus vulgaris]|uniref:Serpin domain-containing protein n=1 Tax=Phaseolus vulgaris TaxID=3885 RepID=V7ATN3_PHAVU|nr:hypothetical protein PHAVU_009G062300g [Phaseolus vulgaris]ESW08645.1 hypothetical protein PHAVU_009G062300g [Phaseolus vulgaris]
MRFVNLVFKVLKYPKIGILKLASLRASVHRRVEKTMDLRESISNQTDVALSMTKLLLSKEARDKNFVYSPLSLHVVLSIIAAGSKGPTLDQLLSFLRSKSTDYLNSFASQLVTVVLSDASPAGGPRLSFADGVWVEQTLSLLPSFKHVVNSDYKANLASVDFQTKAVEVASEVNSWAAKETNGLVKELLPAGSVDSTTRLIFANALYFKGAWNEKFDASLTKDHDFHLLGGNSVKVPFMTSKKKQFIRPFDGFKVLGLRYKQGEDKRQFSMYFFLPDAKDGLPALAEKLASESGFLERELPNQEIEVGDFRIPRFKISFGFEASDVLKELGVVLPFTVGGLTEMVESPVGQNLCVSDIFHKSFIEVNEEGTEAAAATAATIMLRSARFSSKIDFVADHPFLFLIKEDLTGTVLFIGQVLDPRAG